ncbi:MAG: lysophospholipase [Naasia sp.]|uniref:alpha/beta fold hydrolase n=1 Tax=Naasia sp. TaxID=2546198 RepID=UPI00261BF01D|nr:alpha/beta hydrolase [Naasia sp.]MCU1570206.1 lysophospholipase [Naasia sp.]
MPEYTDDYGVAITYHEWLVEEPRAVVQLLHGIGEHALRYGTLAQELNAAGYSVVADDHRGHGVTGMTQHGGDRTRLGRLGPGGLRATIAAISQLSGMLRAGNPGVPLVLIGHSWGSLIAQILLNTHPRDYDAVVLTGTAYRALGYMNGGDLSRRHRHLGTTGAEWLSRDEAVAAAFVADPLNFPAITAKLIGVPDSLRLLGRPARNLPTDLPLLILVGSDDPLGGGRSAERLAESYVRRSGLTDVEAIVYDDARHEVFNEINRLEVVADLLAWLDARVGAPRSAS